MNRIVLLAILLLGISLFAIEVWEDDQQIGTFNERDYDLGKVVTTRDKRGVVNTEVWQGVFLSDFIHHYGIYRFDALEFKAADHYMVRLTKEQIKEFNPLIATARNGARLKKDQYRLVGEELLDLYWIADIEQIVYHEKNEIYHPLRVYSYHTILDHIRMHFDPLKGYKFMDILNSMDRKATGPVRLVSADGVEHTMPLSYFKNAFLLDDETSYSLYASDIPSAMWVKEIMIISQNDKTIFFYENIDKQGNVVYKDFIDFISAEHHFMTYPNMKKITNWDDVDWYGISFVGAVDKE
ncbi:MAG: hypothetical protein FWG20_00470 [Candidatus Cloacimonetes bacterium]|nr:hypothetical protein [Candidatus Cloacimonadota bacterium]